MLNAAVCPSVFFSACPVVVAAYYGVVVDAQARGGKGSGINI